MYIVEVTPLLRGAQVDSLSYFSSCSYEVGTFLEVPVRGKVKRAMVTAVRSVLDDKTAVRSAAFSLRKLPQQTNVSVLPAVIRDTAHELTKQYPVSVGGLLQQLLPSEIKNGEQAYVETVDADIPSEAGIPPSPEFHSLIQAERFALYESRIQDTLSVGKSVVLLVPTSGHVASVKKRLSGAIPQKQVLALSSQLTKRQRDSVYQKIADMTQRYVFVVAPSHAYLGRSDIGLYILEQAGSAQYVGRTRPYVDHRVAVQAMARVGGASCVLADTVLPVEYEARRRLLSDESGHKQNESLTFPADMKVIHQADRTKTDVAFQLFSDEVQCAAAAVLQKGGRVFLYAARRGMAPVVYCGDCGHVFMCPDSGSPYSLLRTHANGQEERWFVSGATGRKVPAASNCPGCDSWRLRERGIGVQTVYDEWKKFFPETPCTLVDAQVCKTPQAMRKACDTFFKQDEGVLVGTQAVLPYLDQSVNMSVVVSADAVRSIPTWRADEMVLRLLWKLRECSAQTLFVQTRTEPDELMNIAESGSLKQFYDQELQLRQAIQYPPYVTFVLVTWEGSLAVCRNIEQEIKTIMGSVTGEWYAGNSSLAGTSTRHLLIRAAEMSGGDQENMATLEEILPRLRSLPPYVKVQINPDQLT